MLEKFPRAKLAHTPTPLEPMDRVTRELGTARVFVKRDDCTGLAMGGNKARQLEFYLGEAMANGCDTVVSTGATQSNLVRMMAAGARKLGLACHIQLEHRVSGMAEDYHTSGNVLLGQVLGAQIYHYPEGEDEGGADARLHEIATTIKRQGGRPYVISITADHPPVGALGYVDAAAELLRQSAEMGINFDVVVLASGGACTHVGMLVGLRALGNNARVIGICVRRDAGAQRERVLQMAAALCEMIGRPDLITAEDVWVDDSYLGPGYGRTNAGTLEAIRLAAEREGLLLDPVYTGKSFAGVIGLARQGVLEPSWNVVFLHTGGAPALFGYQQALFASDPAHAPIEQ
ncbi:MAG: D-cysteine desulfhydrase family protein [Acidiferrobacterales bacterium]